MHFKRIEIVGFKSFLNKTKLKFEPGVTAIVGPNGCGKSNVVDAIKWVLGEQSAKSMRSSSMQDVIFNGTDQQEPVNMAEVSLTLSNEDRALFVDYDEVTISRRLFRSGESEYLLNKTPVRLVDIRDILLGTGIGTSAYSIVEQGKLDLILNAKPEDRRHVFEEASGITKYRAKKREALLKLEHTRNNLIRIADIIHEVERQIKMIERQARKAEKYRTLYDQLKDLDIKLSGRDFTKLAAEENSLSGNNHEMRERCERLKLELDELCDKLTRQRGEYNLIVRELQAAQSEIMRLSSDMDKNKHTKKVNEERIAELKKYIEQLGREIEEITERKEALHSRLEGLEVRCSNVGSRRGEKEMELASSEENVKRIVDMIEGHKHLLKVNREKTVDVVSEQTKTKNMLIKMSADIQNLQARERRLRMEKGNVEAEKDAVSEELEKAQEKLETISRQLEEARKEFQTFNNEYSARQQKLFSLSDYKKEKEKRLNEIKPRREFLEKLISEREGVNEGAKTIMARVEEGDPRFTGVHGILSEIISVHERYEESLEFLLGDISQAIIVENRAVAADIVKFLGENHLGSVSFVILDEIDSPGDPAQESRNISRILTGKEPYHSALCGMLRDVFVANSPEDRRAFIEKNEDCRGRVVGERGEVRQKGMYRSRNYSAKEMISLFGRQEKVKQLREEEEHINRELSGVNDEIRQLEEWLKESTAKKARIEGELRKKQMEFADAQSKKESVKEKADTLAEELLLLDTELEEEIASIKQLREEGDELNQRLNELETDNAELQQLIEESQKIIQDGAREREKTLYKISDIKVELSALRKEEENLTENLNREKEHYSRIDAEVQEKRGRMEGNSERIKDLEEEIESIDEHNQRYDAEIQIKTKENEEKTSRKDELERAINLAEGKSREKEQELEELKNTLRDLDIKRKEIEYKRNALTEKILSTYKVNLAELDVRIEKSANWEEIEKEIEELKEKLDRMGEVSLGAVDEHNQLKERYDFLVRQKDDLERAEDSLRQAIVRINRTTRKMFIETFEAVRSEFSTYYKMLFNGGRADLILTDETNILDSGIDIVAKPPGKKLQNIMLLSGGEKALTAIALVFALFKVNPSPFCILDEIDAPLDESNVVRFSRVLQEFLKFSQFIIVTHNRTTIQLSDILYGVTMEEKGVSKIVSVKFKEEKETSEETIPASA